MNHRSNIQSTTQYTATLTRSHLLLLVRLASGTRCRVPTVAILQIVNWTFLPISLALPPSALRE